MSMLRKLWQPAALRPTQPVSRDKSDTLLLLFACLLVLAPHAAHLPLWISGVCSALLLWRGWITLSGKRMPPRWILLPLALCAMAGVYAGFRTFFGRDAGVAMLVLLLAFKLLEMRASRDLFAVVFLSFFLLLTGFFYSQTMASAALMVVAVITLLAAQLSFQYTGVLPSPAKRLRSAATIVALAVPLTLVLFVLFPRIQGPLWGLPSDANAGRSGLSDRMAPGSISSLALSDAIAFRVKFIDPAPPNSRLYWRGIVLDHYDGRTWTRQAARADKNRPAALLAHGRPVRYQITQEAGAQPWLFALDMPRSAPQLNGNHVDLAPDMQLSTRHAIDDRVRYDLVSYPEYALQPDLSAAALQKWLLLPRGYNPKTLALGAALHSRMDNDADRIRAVLNFFREQNFRYTLQPPLLGRDGIDEFLFSTHAGFCEHYTGAFVVLMRAMGIPARVVTGYQGGEINPVDGFMTVRQSDAHAWAEVWIAQRGWLRIDPTAAVAPNRIERNSATTAAAPGPGGLLNLKPGRNSWLAALRFRWDAVNNGWNQWVLNYTPDRQKNLLRAMGFDTIDWRSMTLLMFAAAALSTLAIAIPLLWLRKKTDPLDAAYATLCKRMAQQGYPRHAHEAPRSYSARLLSATSSLDTEQKRALQHFLMLYEAVRYRPMDPSSRARVLPKLKNLLKQCR